LTGKAAKLITVVPVAVILVSVFGYVILAPKTPNQVVTFTIPTTQETSLPTSLVQTSTMPTSSASATTTTLSSSATTLWINITAAKSASYYLGLLQSNGTQPYVQLATELRKLPDLKNATAVAKITYLALNATNPEVKEAFQLMIKGGTPDPRDYPYAVPAYNTELLGLYQLAEDTGLEKDDTTALTISMTSGLFMTMGDDQVRGQVRLDNSEMLNLAREITEWQASNGYFPLMNEPLEAKIAWAWRGSENVGYKLVRLRDNGNRIDEALYSSMAVSLSTLREMREFVTREWLNRDADQTIKRMENLYIILPQYWAGDAPQWTLGNQTDQVIQNANHVWQYFKAHGKGIGTCTDEATFVDALAKSVGIATIPIEVGGTRRDNSKIEAHAFVLHYDPDEKLWKSYRDQVKVVSSAYKPPYWIDLYLPPVRQTALLWARNPEAGSPPMFATAGYRPTVVNIPGVDFLVEGLASSKLWGDIILPFYLNAKTTIAFSESLGIKEMTATIATDQEDTAG
jgi:hypothetical protein